MRVHPAQPPATITIEARYHGPSGSGNGGYTCGRLAAGIPGPAEVTLRRPPPLDRPLSVLRSLEGLVLLDGEERVAEAREIRFELEPPDCPGLGAAAEAAGRYRGLEEHAFPSCFVCGPARKPADGLRIFPGEVDGDRLVACLWKPGSEFAEANGVVRTEITWAALDCPGAWAWLADLDRPLVLGRLAVVIDAPVIAGRQHVVGGWRLGRDGRKHFSGSVIWRADGTVCARGRATWIEIDPERFAAPG
jgi:hypothetical protein